MSGDRSHDKVMLAGVLACGLSVATYSSWAQFNIAAAAGYPVNLAWVVPVATDATAALGTRAWMSAHYHDGVRHYGRFLALAAIVLSVITAALHLIVPTTGPVPWQIRLVVGGLPSLALAALIHLGALAAQNRSSHRGKSTNRRTASPRAVTGAVEQVSTPEQQSVVSQVAKTENAMNLSTSPSATTHKVGSGSNRDRMFAHLDEHPLTTGVQLDALFHTRNYGRKIRRAWEQANGVNSARASGE